MGARGDTFYMVLISAPGQNRISLRGECRALIIGLGQGVGVTIPRVRSINGSLSKASLQSEGWVQAGC